MAEEQPAAEPAKSIFIVKAKPGSLATAEAWLVGKGWLIDSTDQIKDALPRILSSKPTYIILCMDHANPKIRMLPKLFEQAFQTKVIAYLEGTTPSSLAAISGMEYVLYPPVSGTAIDRMTSKLDRDRKRKAELEAQRQSGVGKASLGTTDSGVIAIKGTAHKSESAIMAEQAKSALMQMMGNEGGYAPSGSTTQEDGGASFKSKSGGADEIDQDSAANDPNSATSSSANELKSATSDSTQGAGSSNGGGSSPSAEDLAAEMAALAEARAMAEAAEGTGTSKKPRRPGISADAPENQGVTVEDHSHSYREKKSKEGPPLVDVTQKAIEQVAKPTPYAKVIPLNECSQGICFFVKSEAHRGFVVCTIAKSPESLLELVQMFREKLNEFMLEFDSGFIASPSVEVSIAEVDFEEWTKDQATFTKKFVHLDRECGIAFFELQPPKPELGPSARQDMVKMNLADIYQGKRLPFDVFLHLPINNRYILYNRRGSLFYDNQKSRLLSKGVTNVHLYEIEIDQLEKYHFEAFLNQNIAEYIRSAKDKKTG